MVRSFVLNENQREVVRSYLEELPSRMPPIIKGVRHALSKVDLDKMESDIALLRRLKQLDVPIGRKRLSKT